jgi:predicted acyltransferase
MSSKTQRYKLQVLVLAGIAGLAIGYGLDLVTPIIKRISTSTFVFASGGWTFLALAFSFWLIDMMKVKKGVKFFSIVGMNPLFIYLFAHVGGAQLVRQIVFPVANSGLSWAGELTVNIAASIMALMGLWYICYWLYKRKIFIKI